IEAAKWVGSYRTEVVRPLHCPIVPHVLPPNSGAHDSVLHRSAVCAQTNSEIGSEKVIVRLYRQSRLVNRNGHAALPATPSSRPSNLAWLWCGLGCTVFLPTA